MEVLGSLGCCVTCALVLEKVVYERLWWVDDKEMLKAIGGVGFEGEEVFEGATTFDWAIFLFVQILPRLLSSWSTICFALIFGLSTCYWPELSRGCPVPASVAASASFAPLLALVCVLETRSGHDLLLCLVLLQFLQ
ncbi:hypothetical protein M9H77_09037 [Catharanthus roseus]|uniref:Uncharacterized protein n=1 Tax=Catharanthus roseus TaxID=4058 RepID=A0ACC0BZS4_CATRO|nr:hypothetical protein M9H77_09037 [Catharanthus roseus]